MMWTCGVEIETFMFFSVQSKELLESEFQVCVAPGSVVHTATNAETSDFLVTV